MKVLLDINVILDVLADREPFAEPAAGVLALLEHQIVDGFIAGHTATTLHYLLHRSLDKQRAKRAIMDLLKLVSVVPVDHDRLLHALAMNWSDFEDAVQVACAEKAEVDYIVTRDPKHFRRSDVPILSPPELLALFAELP